MQTIVENVGTSTLASDTTEQVMIEVGPPEGDNTYWIASLLWFCTNLTQTTTFRIYFWNGDTSNYELVDGTGPAGGTQVFNPASSGKCQRFIISAIITSGSKFKLTAQSSVAEGSPKDLRVSYGFLL